MWNKNAGFSFLELLIVLVLISILTTIGVTQYQQFILKSRRSDAQTSLLDYHARLQRCFIMTHSYQNCIITLNFPQNSFNGFYEIQAINYADRNYTLQATAKNQQRDDSVCYRFTIDQLQQLMAYNQDEQKSNVCWLH